MENYKHCLCFGSGAHYGTVGENVLNTVDGYLMLIPFEHESTVGREDTPALLETLCEVFFPFLTWQLAVFLLHPAVVADTPQVRRVEDDKREGAIGEWQVAEIDHLVGSDDKRTSITQYVLELTAVAEEDARVVLVKVKHLSATGGI